MLLIQVEKKVIGYFSSYHLQKAELIRTVDALGVGDSACSAQSVVVLLVAHQCVHAKDGCKWPRIKTQSEKNKQGRKKKVSYLEGGVPLSASNFYHQNTYLKN